MAAAQKPVSRRGVFAVLIAVTLLAMLATIGVGSSLRVPVLLEAATALWIAVGMLLGAAVAQRSRSRMARGEAAPSEPAGAADDGEDGHPWNSPVANARFRLRALQTAVAIVGGLALASAFMSSWFQGPPPALRAGIAAGLVLAGALLAGLVGDYLGRIDPAELPEAPGLARGARLLATISFAAVAGLGCAWAGWPAGARAVQVVLLLILGVTCLELLITRLPGGPEDVVFPTDFRVFRLFGSRRSPLASALDAAHSQLGIDLRSSWAITVVRRSIEPLVVGVALLAWLSTGLTVVGVEEQALVEHLGVPLDGPPLAPGLHVHWPWPVDRVVRIPARRVQTVHVGHEGEEDSGPEDVLWARRHGTTEYTLLLGNGRDLIAVDAALQFRISDVRAWQYGCVNPIDALRASAYRAVMKDTVGRTLTETLSENVSGLTAEMLQAVQADADALGLGVKVIGMTIGGMHPPVHVANDYQAVVSAALAKTTASIVAQVYRNTVVPKAQAEAVSAENAARADAALSLGRAAGEASSFTTMEAAAKAAGDDYRFRRRLEALESALGGKRFTVFDARMRNAGGELWLMK